MEENFYKSAALAHSVTNMIFDVSNPYITEFGFFSMMMSLLSNAVANNPLKKSVIDL